MRARSWWIGLLGLAPAMAALPSGVTRKPLPDNVVLYERPASAQPLPSFWGTFFELFRLQHDTGTVLPFGRSVALLIGVGNYKHLTPPLEYAAKDVERMRDYLLAEGGFDQVYVMDERTPPELVDSYMTDKFRTLIGKDDRLLFYYSGHGADAGGGHAFLQFQDAEPGQFSRSVLRVDQFDIWSDRIPARHVLFIYDACFAGEAVAKAGDAEAGSSISELSANGSRIVVTAGTAEQKAWTLKLSSDNSYSIFTDALLKALRDGGADRRNRGFVTIEQAVADAQVQLAELTRKLGPGHEMKPVPTNIKASLKGTFVFLNPKAQKPSIPQGDATYMGVTVSKSGNPDSADELEFAHWKSIEPLNDRQLYAAHCELFPNGKFCPVARVLMARAPLPAPTGLVAMVDGQPPSPRELESYSVDQLQTVARDGIPGAVTQLGKAYESGLQGAIQNLPVAISFYTKAADHGDGVAAHRLAAIYYFGRKGVPTDLEEAVRWYQRAVTLGDASAMFDLGVLYFNGKAGLRKDEIKAADLYVKAANGGDANGMVAAGGMYLRGAGGLPQDEKKALVLYQRAVALGNIPGMVALGAMYEHGQGGLPVDERKAVELYQKAADLKEPKGLAYLGLMFEQGKGGLAKSDSHAVDLYRQAAVLDSEDGLAFLASMYEDGKGGLPRDLSEATKLYDRAAQMGNEYAAKQLGRLRGRE